MFKLDNNSDINLLIKYLEGEMLPNINNSSKLTFKTCDMVYPFTNESFDIYPNDNLEGKKVLTVTASADHLLHAIFHGSNDITAFDINIFTKYYSALKIAMIKKYNLDKFKIKLNEIINIHPIYAGYTAVPNSNKKEKLKVLRSVLNDVYMYLNHDELDFWNNFVMMFESKRIFNNFFIEDFLDVTDMTYYNIDNYNNIKEKLHDCSIYYIDSDITSLSNKLFGNSYDVIYISNILSWIENDNKMKILKDLKQILNKNGKVYDYYFDDSDTLDVAGYKTDINRMILDDNSLHIYTKNN